MGAWCSFLVILCIFLTLRSNDVSEEDLERLCRYDSSLLTAVTGIVNFLTIVENPRNF